VPDILFKNLFEVGFSRHINHCIQEQLILTVPRYFQWVSGTVR
jgi:hypothetical protein